MPYKKNIDSWSDLIEDDFNPNQGSERGSYQLQQSLNRLGAGRSIVVDREGRIIAGNKTAEQAHSLGLDIEVVPTDGRKLVVVQRTDLDLADKSGRARELSVADNRVGEVSLNWDTRVLAELQETGIALDEYWRSNELENLFGDEDVDLDIPGQAGSIDGAELDNTADVKAVQLYFDSEDYERFMACLEHFREHFGTGNISDTVLSVLEQAHARAVTQ